MRAANSKGSTLPALQTVLIEAGYVGDASFVKLTATDLLLSLQAPVKANVLNGGAVCVHLATLYALVCGLKDEWLTLTVENLETPIVCKVESGSFSGTLSVLPADEFPRVMFGQEGEYGAALKMELTRDAVKLIRRAVMPFVPANDAREALTYTSWQLDAGQLEVAAADGFRFAKLRVVDFEVNERENGDALQFLVMPRFIAKLEQGEVEQVTLRFFPARDEAGGIQSGGYVVAQVGMVLVRGVLGDGKYPDLEAVATSLRGAMRVTASVAECKYALGLTQIYDDKILLRMDWGSNQMLMTNFNAMEQGKCVIPIPATMEGSGEFEIAFNGLFVRDVMNGAQGDEVVMEFDTPASPARFTARTFTALVMPLNISHTDKRKVESVDDDAVVQQASVEREAKSEMEQELAEMEAVAELAFEIAEGNEMPAQETVLEEITEAGEVETVAVTEEPKRKRRGKRNK